MLKKITSLITVLTIVCSLFILETNVYAATYDPEKVVDYALSQVDEGFTTNSCLKFVKQCFNHCYGFTSTACCAYTYSTKFKDSTSKSNIPIGADVFFKGVGSKCSTCGNKVGHIGIYVGNGYIVHATGGKVQKTKISTIEAWSGCSYTGWGWHGNKSFSTIPSTPKISSVSATADNEITIKWGSVSGASKYVLQGRQAGGSYETIAEISGTSYTHKNLDVGSLYWYKVKATNSAGSSSYSSASGGYTKPTTPTTAIVNTNSIKVNWSSSGGSTNYELLARKCGDDDYTTIAENIEGYTYTHTGLEAGTQYYYKVKAHNKEHTSIISGRSDAGYGFTKLKTPTVISKTATSVYIDWERGSLNGDYTYTYRVRRKLASASSYTSVTTISNSSYTDSGLQPSTTYNYYIDVLRNGSSIVHSDVVTVTTNEQLAESVTISPTALTLAEGATYTLSASVLPSNTNNKTVTWSSSNTNIATVSSNGTITAKAVGSATITAKTSNGKTSTCTVKVDTIENLCSHSYGSWSVSKNATCVNNGEQIRSCSKCSKTETSVVSALGHSYSDEWTVVLEPTCSEYGIKKKLCTVCGVADETSAEDVEMIEHIASDEWIIDKEATCSETGIRHNICAVCEKECNVEEIPVIAHDFEEEWTTEQEATCQQEGVDYRMCKRCSEKEYHYKEKTEHDYALIDLKDATTDETGYATYICNFCNDTYTDAIPVIENEASIIVNSVKAKASQEINVEISVHNNPGIASAKLKIDYDESVMTLKNVTDGGILGSSSHSPSLTSPYTLYWNNGTVTENFTTNGTIAILTFLVNENAEKGLYSINVNFTEDDIFNIDMNTVKLDTNNGELEIINVLFGDLNSDGIVSVKDNMFLSRFIAEWPDYTENTVNTSAADINCDGNINVKDDMILSRHIAEWPGYEIMPYIE